MPLVVQKFGGTSVGSIERIQAVAEKVISTRKEGYDVVVVVSAMSGTTDHLVELARAVQEAPDAREYSALLSTGEQVTIALLSMALLERGYQARSYTGGQASIITDQTYDRARILEINGDSLHTALSQGCIPVVAGFQGVDHEGNITTLGRGGSDTTAVALAAALKADECQIYTDVDGVYTADPRVVPQAKRLDSITFEEMLELASQGAKVLQLRSVEFAGKYNVPLRVLSSFEPGPGTLISYERQKNAMEQPIISGVTFNRREAKLTILGIPDEPGMASKILKAISNSGIDIDMIIQNVSREGCTDFTFTVNRDNFSNARSVLETVAKEVNANGVIGDTKIAKLSLVGVGMRSHPGVATQMFQTLAAEGINIQLISTSEIKVSVVIDEKYIELGVRALHTAFGLDREAKEEFDPAR